jgi:hypothetical protein
MSSKLEFYVPLNCVTVQNPEVIPFLFHSQWFNQAVRKENWLDVRHTWNLTRQGEMGGSQYDSILWTDQRSDTKEPMRKMTMGLSGEAFWDNKTRRTYAKLSLDLSQPRHNCDITLSPIPFSPNGCLKPPFDKSDLATFCCVAKIVLSKTAFWTYEMLSREYCATTGSKDCRLINYEAPSLLEVLKILGLVVHAEGKGYTPVMTIDRFEEVFGIKL